MARSAVKSKLKRRDGCDSWVHSSGHGETARACRLRTSRARLNSGPVSVCSGRFKFQLCRRARTKRSGAGKTQVTFCDVCSPHLMRVTWRHRACCREGRGRTRPPLERCGRGCFEVSCVTASSRRGAPENPPGGPARVGHLDPRNHQDRRLAPCRPRFGQQRGTRTKPQQM